MKKLIILLSFVLFSTSVFAGSCPMQAKSLDAKIAEAQELRDAGVKAHENGNHGESVKLLGKALDLFKG